MMIIFLEGTENYYILYVLCILNIKCLMEVLVLYAW